MSRSGYHDDLEPWDLIRWRGAVKSALRGRRGQEFLREMLSALEAMPMKGLIRSELITESGEVCAIGSVCVFRGLDVSSIDPYDSESVAGALRLSEAMVREIAYENDWRESEGPDERWRRMREWVSQQIYSSTGGDPPPEHKEMSP